MYTTEKLNTKEIANILYGYDISEQDDDTISISNMSTGNTIKLHDISSIDYNDVLSLDMQIEQAYTLASIFSEYTGESSLVSDGLELCSFHDGIEIHS